MHGLAEAVDDEQRVVDADAEADHRRESGGEGRDVVEVADEVEQQPTETHTESGGEQRKAGGDHRAECDEQDDQRDGDTDALTRRGLLTGEGQHLTVGADREAVRAVEVLDVVDDQLGRRRGYVGSGATEGDRGLGDRAVGADR